MSGRDPWTMRVDDWFQFRQLGQEFQTDRSGKPLPDNLWIGPDPGYIPGDNVSGGVTIRHGSRPSQSILNTIADPYWRALIEAVQQKGDFVPIFGTVGTQPILIRPREARTYLILQNTSVANTLFAGFGYQPVITAGGSTGLQMNAGGGAFEPKIVPQQDIWVVGSAGATAFVLMVALG